MNEPAATPTLHRHFGLLHAVALNITQIVGAGIFATVPLMLKEVPGPWAVLGWVAGAVLMLVDGMVWAELGAAMPGSGGSYNYLLDSYGRNRWGRPAAFLFIWQFLISGPLEIASGLIAAAQFLNALSPAFGEYNHAHQMTGKLVLPGNVELGVTLGPARLVALALGVVIFFLLYRRITTLGRLTVTFWVGVLAAIAWILIGGGLRFDSRLAFDFSGDAMNRVDWWRLGVITALAMYSYLGYYNVCYVGDEVRDPGRTIPRAILLSAVIVATLFVALHLIMLGVIPWQDVVKEPSLQDNLPAAVMSKVHGGAWAATLMTLLLVWSCFGSAFAGMLGYARIPYGAARQGHFFAGLARVHPEKRIPHVSLITVCGLTLFWSFFDLQSVINALIVTRILEQFIAQNVGLMRLRATRPDLVRPYKVWLYPLPCLLALAGWMWVYVTSGVVFMLLGATTLLLGVGAFLLWAWASTTWPFQPKQE
jgi:amino acid transporter